MSNRKLLSDQLQTAEHLRRDLIVKPERGTTLAEMLVPQYWVHVHRQLQALDRIEVRPADGSWWAELLVIAVEPFAARVEVLREHQIGRQNGAEIEPPKGYSFMHRGSNGWCAIRLSDGIVLKEKEPSIEAIAAWLAGHLRKLAA